MRVLFFETTYHGNCFAITSYRRSPPRTTPPPPRSHHPTPSLLLPFPLLITVCIAAETSSKAAVVTASASQPPQPSRQQRFNSAPSMLLGAPTEPPAAFPPQSLTVNVNVSSARVPGLFGDRNGQLLACRAGAQLAPLLTASPCHVWCGYVHAIIASQCHRRTLRKR